MKKTISLAYALKLKSRLMKKAAELYDNVNPDNNVYTVDTKESIKDPTIAIDEWRAVRNKLHTILALISKANAENDIPLLIAQLDTYHTEIKFLKRINTSALPITIRNPVTGEIEKTERFCYITEQEKEIRIAEFERLISATQDQIDSINGSCTIDVEENLFI